MFQNSFSMRILFHQFIYIIEFKFLLDKLPPAFNDDSGFFLYYESNLLR